MLLFMNWQQLVLVCLLGFSCTHETAASGATDTHEPQAERAPAELASEASAAPSSATSSASCVSDADCHPVDVYCGGCQCIAMPVTTAVPKCQGNEVHCFAQPCRGQRAVCKGGGCSLAGSGSEQ